MYNEVIQLYPNILLGYSAGEASENDVMFYVSSSISAKPGFDTEIARNYADSSGRK